MTEQSMDLQAALDLADEVSPDPTRAHAALTRLRDELAVRMGGVLMVGDPPLETFITEWITRGPGSMVQLERRGLSQYPDWAEPLTVYLRPSSQADAAAGAAPNEEAAPAPADALSRGFWVTGLTPYQFAVKMLEMGEGTVRAVQEALAFVLPAAAESVDMEQFRELAQQWARKNPNWVAEVLTGESWQQWRADNPGQVAAIAAATADIKQQARELLAAEWVRDSHNFTARLIRDGKLDGPQVSGTRDVDRAVRAIAAALASRAHTPAKHHAALQRIGTALGLPAGSDLHTECVPAIEVLRATAAAPAEWQPNDADVLAWRDRYDLDGALTLTEAATAIDDARSLHMLAAAQAPGGAT